MAASLVVLVSGGSYTQREAAIVDSLRLSSPSAMNAVILEGLPDGNPQLIAGSTLQLHRIAPGCMCCIGNLVLRVTLNRVLKHRPAHLYLSLAENAHVEKILQFLAQAPYNTLLALDSEIRI
jgi:hypothetical protein